MRSAEFWLLHDSEVEALLTAWRNREKRADRRVARVLAALGSGSEDDYMPKPPETKEQREKRSQRALESSMRAMESLSKTSK